MERKRKKNDRSSKRSPDQQENSSNPLANSSQKRVESGPSSFLKYSGIAFEMVATIGVATYGGYLLDSYLNLKFPAFLLSFALLSLIGSMYLLYKRLPKD